MPRKSEDKVQLNLWLNADTVKALGKYSGAYGFRGRAHVGADVIEKLLPAWVQMQETLRAIAAGSVSVFAPEDTKAPLGKDTAQMVAAGQLDEMGPTEQPTAEDLKAEKDAKDADAKRKGGKKKPAWKGPRRNKK